MSTLIPCKHLDYSPNYDDCEIKTLAPHYPQVRFWQRGERWTDGGRNPRDVQFCGQGRGRINGIFQCYNGEMHCYEADHDALAADERK
jgi:hypothetical protein